ncbi:MAG: hypothetical protein IPI05_06525 [Flavobacteriales bacterium]|nr:hypothetical protein [Flavobacteriales bacterium]
MTDVLVLPSTGNGNCTAVQDSLVIIVDPVPVVNAGPDQICANNPNFQLNGFVGNAPGGNGPVAWATTSPTTPRWHCNTRPPRRR